ncbi:acyl-CoA Delta-9 desaturase [Halyomorpha halys]|uniref:acyl-CoA Delta-9 desaturase n=1 Tax=Halyomorpha halys TaxID=286706 RepID=UPI0006D51BC4|nr:acyl-CoA desaturase-like [Halyomorpha halys]XP_014270365.1 acyl-CoA desaturase-like [Halyomorpha halys]
MGYKTENINEIENIDASEIFEKAKTTKPFKPKIAWANVLGFLFLHLACLYGLYLFHRAKFLTLAFGLFLMHLSGLSTTLGAHRLWSHRSYKVTLPLKLILLFGFTMAGQNCLWIWVRDHRQHHKYSDTDGDPHNSTRGFFFCHMGWLMVQKHPEVIAKGRQIDMTDLNADPLIMFQKRYYKTLYTLCAVVIPVLIPWYFWNEDIINSLFICFFARYVLQLHLTWCVNSVAHLFGTKPYDKRISPVESTFVSFFGLGEGWHNYHHTFPWDCHAAEFGKHFNLSSRLLTLLERWGLAYDLKVVSKQMMINKITKYGDGTHPVF